MIAPPSTKGRRIKRINAFTQGRLIRLLLEGAYSCQELADETGLHYVTVLEYCRELHRSGAAHICAWEKDNRGRDIIKIYKIGVGKDEKRQKKTQAERQASYRAKKRMMATIAAISGCQPVEEAHGN